MLSPKSLAILSPTLSHYVQMHCLAGEILGFFDSFKNPEDTVLDILESPYCCLSTHAITQWFSIWTRWLQQHQFVHARQGRLYFLRAHDTQLNNAKLSLLFRCVQNSWRFLHALNASNAALKRDSGLFDHDFNPWGHVLVRHSQPQEERDKTLLVCAVLFFFIDPTTQRRLDELIAADLVRTRIITVDTFSKPGAFQHHISQWPLNEILSILTELKKLRKAASYVKETARDLANDRQILFHPLFYKMSSDVEVTRLRPQYNGDTCLFKPLDKPPQEHSEIDIDAIERDAALFL